MKKPLHSGAWRCAAEVAAGLGGRGNAVTDSPKAWVAKCGWRSGIVGWRPGGIHICATTRCHTRTAMAGAITNAPKYAPKQIWVTSAGLWDKWGGNSHSSIDA